METTLGWHFNIAPFYINSHNSNTIFKAKKISAPMKETTTNNFYKKNATNHIQQGSRDGDDLPGTEANGRFYFSPST